MELVGASQDLEDSTARQEHVQMIVEPLDGAIMEPAFAILNSLTLVAKSVPRTRMFQLNVH